jgi:predicted kinase
MKRTLIILKGIGSSGKSTFAKLISKSKICCADDYFEGVNGNYNFDASKLSEAHAHCRQQFDDALNDKNIENIVICNTNCKESDYAYYVRVAQEQDLMITYVVLEKRHDNANHHNLPEFVLERQHTNLINNLKLK